MTILPIGRTAGVLTVIANEEELHWSFLNHKILNMKRLSLFFSLAVLVFFSCSKDEFLESKHQNNYSLSEIEQEFFDFDKSIGASLRRDKSYRITPEVIKVHQFVLQENQKNKFAEGINTKVGTPYWNHAYTFKTNTQDFYVLIPMYNKDLSKINGYLSGMNSSNGIVLNGMTRTKLLSNLSTNSAIKKSTLTVLAKQEIILTGSISPEVDNALCILREEINSNGIQFEGSEVLNDGSNPCNPELIEICIDQEGGYHWFGGLENLPIHLDHDQDGIINSEDQDWHERRFDMTQEEFTAFILDHWNQNMYDDYGDYYEFWDEMGDYYDDYDGGQDWSSFINDLVDFWDDFGDWWSDLWYDIGSEWDDFWGGIGDWFEDLFGDGIDCPEWPLQDDKESISTRSIECFTFYAWDCYDNPDYNWWSFYDGYDDNAVLLHRVNNYLDNVLTGQVDFWTLYNIAQESGCDPLSSDFEQCLDWHFNDNRDAILEDMYSQMFPNMDFLPMVRWLAKNCELGGGTQADYNSCIMTQYNSAKSNIETFLTDRNVNFTVDQFVEIFLEECSVCNIMTFEEEMVSVFVDYLNLGSEFGLTSDQINDFKSIFSLDVQKVPLPFKLDWSEENNARKITQTYYCLSFIDAVYQNLNMSPNISYSLNDFFTNISGTASIDIVANIDISILGENIRVNGEQFEIVGSKLVINEIYTPKTFHWDGNIKDSPYGNIHYYFPKTGSSEWGFSILNFIIPNDQWQNFYYED